MAQPRFVSPELSRHIQHASAAPMLSQSEEASLAVAAKSGDLDARHRLAESYTKYAISLARKSNQISSLDDLISTAYVGLMEAIDAFNPDLGHRLSTYMVFPVRYHLTQHMLANWSMVPSFSGGKQQKLFFALLRARDDIDVVGGPSLQVIDRFAQQFQMSRTEVEEAIERVLHRDTSLQTPASRDSEFGDLTLQDMLVDPSASPEESALLLQQRTLRLQLLQRGLEHLDDRTRVVITARMLTEPAVTLSDLGLQFSVSKERIRQIESAGLVELTSWVLKRALRRGI